MTRVASFRRGRRVIVVQIPKGETPTNRANPFAAFKAAQQESE